LRALDELGMTKKELAEKANISLSFLSDLTNAKANPSLKIMEAIAGALGTPLPALLESTDLPVEDFENLMEGQSHISLPDKYTRVCAILTEYQAYQVKRWGKVNKMQLKKLKSKLKKTTNKKVL
jgi:transcriptional regulator with XRE-family HTH domain